MYLFNRKMTGYRKAKRGLACEDAVLTKDHGDYCVMACADGHGDPKCKYAARGAELAVWIAARELNAVRERCESVSDMGTVLSEEREKLIQRIVCGWVEAVLDDYRARCPEDNEFAAFYKTLAEYSRVIYEVRDGSMPIREFRSLAEHRHRCEDAIYKITLLYGTTLNAAVVCNRFVFALGIGDGDVIAVNGRRVEWLLPSCPQFNTSPASLSGNFGTILENFAAIYVPVTRGGRISDSRFLPELVMISSDGLRNAFLSDDAFIDKILEIANAWKEGKGYNFVRNSRRWLEERTQFGVTQDDISFCFFTKHAARKA